MVSRVLTAACALTVIALSGCTAASGGATPPAGTTSSSVPAPTVVATAPTPGDSTATVPSPRGSTKAPVDLDKPASAGKVVVRVVGLKAVNARAKIPGEVSGPGLAVTVKVTNNSARPLDAAHVLVTIFDSKKAPGGEMTGSPANPMNGSIEPGANATGVYLFTVAVNRRSPVTVYVALPTETPALAFRGDAPK